MLLIPMGIILWEKLLYDLTALIFGFRLEFFTGLFNREIYLYENHLDEYFLEKG